MRPRRKAGLPFAIICDFTGFIGLQSRLILILAILIPASVLTLFLLPLPREPINWQKVTAQPVALNITRPSSTRDINQSVQNYHRVESATVNFTVNVIDYLENSPFTCAIPNADCLGFSVNVAARAGSGYFSAYNMHFAAIDANASLNILEDRSFIELGNLTIDQMKDSWNTAEPSVMGSAVGQPSIITIQIRAWWIFIDSNTQNHSMIISLEVYFLDGMNYREAIIPIVLGVLLP